MKNYLVLFFVLVMISPIFASTDSTFIAVARYGQPSIETQTNHKVQQGQNVFILGGNAIHVKIDSGVVSGTFTFAQPAAYTAQTMTRPQGDSLKNKLDSLLSCFSSDSIKTAQIDSVNNTHDSLVVPYTKWVQWSVSADSAFVVDFNSSFTNPKVFAAGSSYTTKPLPIVGHNKLYMKKKSIYDGYTHRNLVAEGK